MAYQRLKPTSTASTTSACNVSRAKTDRFRLLGLFSKLETRKFTPRILKQQRSTFCTRFTLYIYILPKSKHLLLAEQSCCFPWALNLDLWLQSYIQEKVKKKEIRYKEKDKEGSVCDKSEPGIAQYVQALLPLDGIRPFCRLSIRQNLTRSRKLRRLSRWWIEWPLVHAFARCLRRKAMNRRSRRVAGVVTKLRHVFPWLA